MSRLKKPLAHVLVCQHKDCLHQGARAAAKALKAALKENHLRKQVMVTKVDCLDRCGLGPVWVVYPEGVWYGAVDEAKARKIVESHLRDGRPLRDCVLDTAE